MILNFHLFISEAVKSVVCIPFSYGFTQSCMHQYEGFYAGFETMENSAPTVHVRAPARAQEETNFVDDIPEEFDSREIFGMCFAIVCEEWPE